MLLWEQTHRALLGGHLDLASPVGKNWSVAPLDRGRGLEAQVRHGESELCLGPVVDAGHSRRQLVARHVRRRDLACDVGNLHINQTQRPILGHLDGRKADGWDLEGLDQPHRVLGDGLADVVLLGIVGKFG
jgi:hypothetical protein